MQSRAVLLALCVALPACSSSHGNGTDGSGGEGSEPSGPSVLGTCGLRTEVAGGAAIRFTGQNDATCLSLHSSGAGLDVIFSGSNAKGSVELSVGAVTEGQTGADFSTRVVVTNTAREHWQGDGCFTSITEHRLLDTEASSLGELRHYQVSGAGTCSASLDSVPAAATPATISPFDFRAEFTWRD